MDNKKKKKRELPVTGILAGFVVVLLICLAAVVWFNIQNKNQREQGQGGNTDTKQTGAQSLTEIETGDVSLQKDKEMQSETAPQPATEMQTQEEIQTAAETETETETETEAETEEKKLVVAIDPGHQGSWVNMSDTEPLGPGSSEMKAKASTGTQGTFSGKTEYELNLEVSLLLRTELEKRGYEVILTREDHDTAISNSERALMAYEQGGDIYVRIHANGSEDASVSGALAMVPSQDNPYVGNLASDSYLLADCILSAYCSEAEFQSLGIQYYDNMTGINWSKLPVMILEMGFMTNESDDLRMADSLVQSRMATGIADGIDQYFLEKGMKEKEVSREAQNQMNALLEQIGEDLVYPAGENGENWAVSIKNLTTGAQGDVGGDEMMKSASVIKVFLMAAIYDRVCYPASEERHIYFDETYDGELKQLITDMITVSDNDAANTLLERLGQGDASVGMQVVNQFCEENGYTATHMGRKFLEENPSGDNVTSANDCLRLLESIYNGTCVGAEASAKMYEYLRQQTRTNKIPAGLEETAAVTANKTGELAGDYGDYVENDIAVVEDADCVYILCILSQNLTDNATAVKQIHNVSSRVNAAFTE